MESFKSYTDRVATITPNCLGYLLQPFSLGHSMLLKACRSKFVTEKYNGLCDINEVVRLLVTEKELIMEFVVAVLICSSVYDDFKKEVALGEFNIELESLIKRIGQYDLMNEIHTFAHYIRTGTQAPIYKLIEQDDNGSVKVNPVEPEEAILSTLMCECGYTRQECLTLPMTETLSAYLLYAHKMGNIELESKEVFELKQKLKELDTQ